MAEQVVKDVVAHRPREADTPPSSRPQPPSSVKSVEDPDEDHTDTSVEPQTPIRTGVKLTRAQSKEDKVQKKQRFAWARKR